MPRPPLALSCLLLATAALPAHGGVYGPNPNYRPPAKQKTSTDVWWARNAGRFAKPGTSLTTAQLARVRTALTGVARRAKSPEVRSEALLTLAGVGRCAPDPDLYALFEAQLTDAHPRVRTATLLGLGLLGDHRGVRALAHVARSSLVGRQLLATRGQPIAATDRAHACRGLGLLLERTALRPSEQLDIVRLLAAQLTTPTTATTIPAIEALGRLPRDAEDTARSEALRALGRHWDRRISAAAERHSQLRVPLAIGRLLGRGASRLHTHYRFRFLSCVRDGLQTSDRRAAAVLALAHLLSPGDKEPNTTLQNLVRSGPNTRARQFAALALGEIGGGENRLLLSEMLTSVDAAMRRWSALGLGILAHRRAGDTRNAEVRTLLSARLRSDRASRDALRQALQLAGGPGGPTAEVVAFDTLLATVGDSLAVTLRRTQLIQQFGRRLPPGITPPELQTTPNRYGKAVQTRWRAAFVCFDDPPPPMAPPGPGPGPGFWRGPKRPGQSLPAPPPGPLTPGPRRR